MVEQISRDEFAEMMDPREKTALLDVLPKDSYYREHIKLGTPGQPLIPGLIFLELGQGRVFYNIMF